MEGQDQPVLGELRARTYSFTNYASNDDTRDTVKQETGDITHWDDELRVEYSFNEDEGRIVVQYRTDQLTIDFTRKNQVYELDTAIDDERLDGLFGRSLNSRQTGEQLADIVMSLVHLRAGES